MNINDLIFYMQCGEEIEIYIGGQCYFLQPDYKRFNKDWGGNSPAYPFTIIYDCYEYENPKKIFVGTAEEIVNYRFENKYTLKNNISIFKFVW